MPFDNDRAIMELEKAFHEMLRLGPRVTVLPVIHGSGDFARAVRDWILRGHYDCIALPLPDSCSAAVESAIGALPVPSVVVQREPGVFLSSRGEDDSEEAETGEGPAANYIPIDPCQPVIAAIRTAISERIPRRYVDLETSHFLPDRAVFPDPYALKKVPLPQLAATLLPFIPRPGTEQVRERIRHMAWMLREWSIDFRNILFVCHLPHWPWIRESFHQRDLQRPEGDVVEAPGTFHVDPRTHYFLLGEIPYITGLYEQARAELDIDENLSIDGIKSLLLAGRENYRTRYRNRARRVSPLLVGQMLKYIRNLTLIGRRMTPDLIDVITAAKQVTGDGYALEVLELARTYPWSNPPGAPAIRMGIDEAAFPDGEVRRMKSRLPGPPVNWTRLELRPHPDESSKRLWKQKWNPHSQCSWPPEDTLIENFRAAVFDRALQITGADMARTEKFTTSIRDGIDIRDTLRHWYEGDIYVKVLPPGRGVLDAAVMLFDSPADPREYPWRTTWFAEHREESTLAFFATDFRDQPVGPGICVASYGGAMFLYPPLMIPDIWRNRRFDAANTLEERLLHAACFYSRSRHVALLSEFPPGAAWKLIARMHGKTLVHVPLKQFGESTVQQLRLVHVLGGKQVRSYAAEFIRRV